MYITISKQKMGENYSSSVSDFVAYLEKENEGKEMETIEHFFNQYSDEIDSKEVIKNIDGNIAKLKKTEPKYYSMVVSPSSRELKRLQNPSTDLKAYTRELMKVYADNFNKQINGRPLNVNDIMYYAKVEHERTYKGTDKAIKENAPYQAKIARLNNEIRKIARGELTGSVKKKQREIALLQQEVPHKINGEMITQGMAKQGSQTHIHIIVSRKDASNSISVSPGSTYKSSTVEMNGKTVKRGFNRDEFSQKAEQTFDKLFNYNRNYVETYKARKLLIKNPTKYFMSIMRLPTSQKAIALKLLSKSSIPMPKMNIPTNKAQLVFKVIKKLKRGLDTAVNSGSIDI